MHRSSHVFITMLMAFALFLPMVDSTAAQADSGTPIATDPDSRPVDQVPEPILPTPTATSPSITDHPPANSGPADDAVITPTTQPDQTETLQISPQLSISAAGGDVPAGTAVHIGYLSHGYPLTYDVITQAGTTLTLDLPPVDTYSDLHIHIANATGFQVLDQSITVGGDFLIIPLQLQPLPVPTTTSVTPTVIPDAAPPIETDIITPAPTVEASVPTATTAPGSDATPPALTRVNEESPIAATPDALIDANTIGIEAVAQIDLVITAHCACTLDIPSSTSYYISYVSGGVSQRQDGTTFPTQQTWTLPLRAVDIGSTLTISISPPFNADMDEYIYGSQRVFTIGSDDTELEIVLEKGVKDVAYAPPVEITLPDASTFPAGSIITYSDPSRAFTTIGDDDLSGATSPHTVYVQDELGILVGRGVTPNTLYGVKIEVPGYRTWLGTYLPTRDGPLHVTMQPNDTPDFSPSVTLVTADGLTIPVGWLTFYLYNETNGHILADGFEDLTPDSPIESGTTWSLGDVAPDTTFYAEIYASPYENYTGTFTVNELNPNFTIDLQLNTDSPSSLHISTSDGADIPAGATLNGTAVNNGVSTNLVHHFGAGDDRSSGVSITLGAWSGSTTFTLSITGASGYAPLTQTFIDQPSPVELAMVLQKVDTTVIPTLEIRTSDGQPIPTDTRFEVWTASGDLIYGHYIQPAADSGTEFPIFLDMSAVELEVPEYTTLEIKITFDLVDDPSYQVAHVAVVVTSANPIIIVTLDTKIHGNFTPNLKISTSNSQQILAGTSITMYGSGETIFSNRLDTAEVQPYTIPLSSVLDGRSYRIVMTGAPGFAVFDQTFTASTIARTWEAELQADTSTSTSPLTITTSDSAPIPPGTSIEVTNTSDGNTTLFTETLADAMFSGNVFDVTGVVANSHLSVHITNATGYQNTTQQFVINNLTPTMELELQTSETKPSSIPAVRITTSNGHAIPAGAIVQVTNTSFGGPVVFDQTVQQAVASGVQFNLPAVVDNSLIRILISAATGFDDLSQEFTLDASNTLLAVELQANDDPNVTLTMQMAEGTTIPDGTTWALTASDDSPLQNGSVPSGAAAPWSITLPGHVAIGEYKISVSSPALFYDEVQSLPVTGPTASATFIIARPVGNLTATVDTENDGLIPAGTTWKITGSDTVIVASGTLNGGTASEPMNLPDVLGYDNYTIDITPGDDTYAPNAGSFSITQATTIITFTLIAADATEGTVNLTVSTSDGQPIPTGAQITIGGIAHIVTDGGVTATGIASGTLIPFTNVPIGVQTVVVTNATPYEDFQGSTTVIAADVIDLGITLQLAEGDDTGVDAGTDSATDTGGDTGSDTGADAGTDAGTDAGSDSGSDSGTDSAKDTGSDAGSDSGTDSATDTGTDAGSDSGSDTGTDSATDTGGDTGNVPGTQPTVIPGRPSAGGPGSGTGVDSGTGAGNQNTPNVTSLPVTGQGTGTPSESAILPLLIPVMLLLLIAGSGAFRHRRR